MSETTAQRPLVSIIIPVYNGEAFLAKTLQSVFAQDYRPIEVIVVDDGSTDRTAEIAQSFSNVRYIYQPNQGPAYARNQGIAAAQGDLLAFLDADDTWLVEKISAQVNYLEEHPHIGFVVTHMHVELEPGAEWPPNFNRQHYEKDPPCMLPSALVVRKEVMQQIGVFDVRYRHANDSDWFLRARDAGVPMGIIPRVLLIKRMHSSNLSREATVAAETMAAVRASIHRKKQTG